MAARLVDTAGQGAPAGLGRGGGELYEAARQPRPSFLELGQCYRRATHSSPVSNGEENAKRSAEKRSAVETEEDVAQPAPPKVSKFGFAMGGQTGKPQQMKPQPGISIKLAANKPKEVTPAVVPKVHTVASIFNEDDSEPEEMPPEAKMRMKNIGRDTPTSAGPNSFNKGKHGFSDNQKLWERNIKSRLGESRHHHDD